MIRKYLSISMIFLYTLLLFSCKQGVKSDKSEQEKTTLTVTIEPQRYILHQIVEDNFNINTLVPPGTSPETYEPAPSVMVEMSKSDYYFIVGDLGFEKAWSKRLVENNPNVKVIDCSQGIELIEGEEHHHTDEKGHTHSHGSLDPHVWSSPSAVKQLAKNMFNAVVESDPENEETYFTNYDRFVNKVDSVDKVISDLLTEVPTRSFIIFHPSLGYFANEYNLHQHSIEYEGKSPSPSQIKSLIDIAKKENINTVFIQKGFDIKNAEVIAKEIEADVFEIDPLSYDWDTELIKIAQILSRDKDNI